MTDFEKETYLDIIKLINSGSKYNQGLIHLIVRSNRHLEDKLIEFDKIKLKYTEHGMIFNP